MYGKDTLKTMNGFYTDIYDDPFEVRKLFTDERKALISFSVGLWNMMLDRFPCKKGLTHKEAECCRRDPICRTCSCRQELSERMAKMADEGGDPYENERRNLNNWLVNGKPPKNRETYIKLCYALCLRIFPQGEHPEKYILLDAERFLLRVCGQAPFYTGDAVELAHIFTLMGGEKRNIDGAALYDSAERWTYSASLAEKITQKAVGKSKPTRMEIDSVRTEDALIRCAPSAKLDDARYKRARLFLADYNRHVEDDNYFDEDLLKSAGAMRRRINRETARRMLSAYIEMDDEEMANAAPLFDVLYYSSLTRKMAKGEMPVSRSVLLLTVLAENVLPVESRNGEDENVDISELESFAEFFSLTNKMLRECDMAPLYPRRPFDFCVLYTFYLYRRDKNDAQSPEEFYRKAVAAMKGRCIE